MLKSLKTPRNLIAKVILLLVVTVVIISTANHGLSKPTVNQYKQKVHRAIQMKFRTWTGSLLASKFNLESNQKFLAELESIKAEKLANDASNELWDINEKVLHNLPLEVDTPEYFFADSKKGKPVIQPYDMRFTLGIYLRWIKEHAGEPIPFHWSDWVDLTKLNKYVLPSANKKTSCEELFDISGQKEMVEKSKLLGVGEYCHNDSKFPLGFRIVGFPGPQTVQNHEILAKSYLYSGAPSPVRLIFMTESKGSYEHDVVDSDVNSLKNSLLQSSMVESVTKTHKSRKVNVLDSYNELVSLVTPKNGDEVLMGYEITIPQEEFKVDPHAIIKSMESEPSLNKVESAYLDSVKYSVSESNPPKFFNETKLLEKFSQKWLGEHYDWRFFNGINVGGEEQLLSLHRLVKNYLSFTRQHGIVTWIAHGSLLSWYWNGIAFPWDTDIDVQMPIAELHKLGRRFNQTLVIENAGTDANLFNGMGKYFIDVGSSITHRTKGNGNNNIDARFIDVDTGLYIDITGLAMTDAPAPSRYDYIIQMDKSKQQLLESSKNERGEMNHEVKNKELQAYNCRNNHFNTFEELSPLILTVVENQLSYIPRNFIMSLNYEYGVKGLTDINFKDYFYVGNLRMWIKTSKVLDYMKNPTKWMEKHGTKVADKKQKTNKKILNPKQKRVVSELEKLHINQLTLTDYINLLQDNAIFKEFVKTYKFTKVHELELKYLMRNDFKNSADLVENYRQENEVGTGLRSDLFMYKVFKDSWNYSNEVENLVKLTEAYQSV